MQYRKFGRLGWDISALGFGCMRLPVLQEDHAQIDEPEAMRMLRYAIDHGVNYVDTAYPYHSGESERFLGRALQDGYRGKVKLATKMPSWLIQSAEDFDRYLDEQLERLQTDFIDIYLLHGLRDSRWSRLSDLDVLKWAEGAMAAGRFGHLGFSFHDDYPVFQEIIDAYDNWAMCQVQYNYMDIENQAGTQGVQYAASKGIAVVVMEPLLGGRIVSPPPAVQAIWDSAPVERTPADWALQWLWNQSEVSVVLSGMSTMEQVEQNVASAERAAVGAMTPEELALVEQVRDQYNALCPIPCTSCGYCMPCPNGVDIPRNFRIYNQGVMFDVPDQARSQYAFLETTYQRGDTPDNPQAVACIQCRECEDKCPQSIPISEWMPIVHAVLGEGEPYDACPAP